MSEKILIFSDKEINKNIFYKRKHSINVDDVDYYGKKDLFEYFIGYKSNGGIRPLSIKFTQVRGYVKCSDRRKVICFMAKDNKLIEVYNAIWKESSNLKKKWFVNDQCMIINT